MAKNIWFAVFLVNVGVAILRTPPFIEMILNSDTNNDKQEVTFNTGKATNQCGRFPSSSVPACAVSADFFDDPDAARKAAMILAGLLFDRSPRLSEIARETKVSETAN